MGKKSIKEEDSQWMREGEKELWNQVKTLGI
jgi:hypothetical protein